MTPSRRHLLRLALGSGALVLTGRGTPAEEGQDYASHGLQRRHPLEFRLDSSYRPELSEAAAGRLARVSLEFLHEEHPPGTTVSFWELNPREMPYLKRHLQLVVEHVFEGVKRMLDLRPVDPIAVLALLYNESRFHPKIVSPAGAAGIAQFMPETALEYGLAPVARADLWSGYRKLRELHGKQRSERIERFLAQYGLPRFEIESAIDHAIETGDTEVLTAYRGADAPSPEVEAARRAYVTALETDFDRHHFFWDGREPLGAMDGRITYRAVVETVRYLARSLDRHQGMISTAVASYNAGPDSVANPNPRSILHRFGELPPYAETVRYVQRFMAVYAALKYRLFLAES